MKNLQLGMLSKNHLKGRGGLDNPAALVALTLMNNNARYETSVVVFHQ